MFCRFKFELRTSGQSKTKIFFFLVITSLSPLSLLSWRLEKVDNGEDIDAKPQKEGNLGPPWLQLGNTIPRGGPGPWSMLHRHPTKVGGSPKGLKLHWGGVGGGAPFLGKGIASLLSRGLSPGLGRGKSAGRSGLFAKGLSSSPRHYLQARP